MARRRRQDTADMLQEIFLLLPWWIGPPVAALVYVCLLLWGHHVSSNKSVAIAAQGSFFTSLAPIFAAFALIIWLFALGAKAKRRLLLHSNKPTIRGNTVTITPREPFLARAQKFFGALLTRPNAGLNSINNLSWKDFELLVGEAYRQDGYMVQEFGGSGPDGGIDLIARRADEVLLIQCKHWKQRDVGVKFVREMFGVMHSERATGVVIVTTGTFSDAAIEFAEGKPIRLMHGDALAAFIARAQPTPLSADSSAVAYSAKAEASREGGSRTSRPLQPPPSKFQPAAPVPSIPPADPDRESDAPRATPHASLPAPLCPRCGAEMVVRTAKKGAHSGSQFLGCGTYPKCRGKRELPTPA